MFSSNTSQVSEDRLYVEDVFSTYLYTGNGSSQTITNGIDLAGKGGMVWIKNRGATANNLLIDTARGSGFALFSNLTNGNGTGWTWTANSNGFSTSVNDLAWSNAGNNYASWTFREAPKFFDVVTYTGNGNTSQTISHNLGVEPGCIIIKRLNATSDWSVYHRGVSSPNSSVMALNTTAAKSTYGSIAIWNPTATTFTADRDYGNTNSGGGTYVAYLFAHDATFDGIIQCGSFTTDGSGNATVNLGWEPQWGLFKRSDSTGNWDIIDNMRGFPSPSNNSTSYLLANTSDPEAQGNREYPTATGFGITGYFASATYIYIAIRRGPMRTPTTGTSVFTPVSHTPSGVTTITTNFPVDMTWFANRSKASFSFTGDVDRLRGTTQTSTRILSTNATDAEGVVNTYGFGYDRMTSITDNFSNSNWGATTPVIYWNFRRAPSFMDVVCYTGTGSARTVSHNLGVTPELMILKQRSGTGFWVVYAAPLGIAGNKYLDLSSTGAAGVYGSIPGLFNGTDPTSTVFSVGNASQTNQNVQPYVAYLFASCPGVSKVFSFTGNGSSQTINCGFSGGARFILIKRTDSTGNWVVFDSARGIVSGNDPSLLLNSTAAETNYDDIDPDSSGFVVNQSTNNLNVNGASYIGLAIS